MKFESICKLVIYLTIILIFSLNILLIPIGIISYPLRFVFYIIITKYLKNKYINNHSNSCLKYFDNKIKIYHEPNIFFINWTEILFLFC